MRNVYWMALAGAALLAAPSEAAAQDPMQLAKGAEVWAQNCTRCHIARPSTERSDRDWLTIVAHMRARANLTRAEADAVAGFLIATNSAMPTVSAAETSAVLDSMPARDGASPGPGGAGLTPEQRALVLRYLRLLRPR